jgi:phage protein D/phage baseplate assembly protein gpV
MPVTYVAEPILKINGQTASSTLIEDLLQVSVEESLHLPAFFTLIIKNDYFSGRSNEQPWHHQNLFEIGTPIQIGFGSSTTEAPEFEDEQRDTIFDGEVTAIETHFTSESQAPIVIRGYDYSHRLHRGRYNRSFQNMTDSDIVNKIIGEVGIRSGTIDQTREPHEYIFQENQTNMEFLRERAARNGFELFVQNGKLNFRKPAKNSTLQLKWLEDVHSFRVRVSSAEQVSNVEVRGWDYTQKRTIVETASREKVLTENQYGRGSKTSRNFKGQPPTPTAVVVNQPVYSNQEATNIAQAICNELGGEFVHADAHSEGNPEIRPGKVVKLQNLGKYSGEYYITETRHLFQERIYTTEFSVRGLRGGDLLATLAPAKTIEPGQSLLIGLVTDNQDKQGWGRVRVKFPTLTEEHQSHWARVVNIGGGPQRGFHCLPEINDEVLVGFEHGDIHRPFVIGGLWNGKDKPPRTTHDTVQGGKVRLRTLQTRTGHTLQFVEEDQGSSNKGIYLTSVYGHHVYLNDSEQYIEIKTNNGHQVRLDDKNKKVLIKTQNGHSCELNDQNRKLSIESIGQIDMNAPQKITLTVGGSSIEIAPSGIKIQTSASINIQGLNTDVKGTTTVNVQGMTANLKGTTANVQAGTVGISGGMVRINS